MEKVFVGLFQDLLKKEIIWIRLNQPEMQQDN
jgi:hypothetical protein